MSEQKPGVGRIVHYVSHGTPHRRDGTQAFTAKCRAAVITEVLDQANDNGECLSLCVLNPTGQFFHVHTCQDDGAPFEHVPSALCTGLDHAGGTWHWPARV